MAGETRPVDIECNVADNDGEALGDAASVTVLLTATFVVSRLVTDVEVAPVGLGLGAEGSTY